MGSTQDLVLTLSQFFTLVNVNIGGRFELIKVNLNCVKLFTNNYTKRHHEWNRRFVPMEVSVVKGNFFKCYDRVTVR